MVIGNDFFKELTNKIGKDSAVDFLSYAAQSGKTIDVALAFDASARKN